MKALSRFGIIGVIALFSVAISCSQADLAKGGHSSRRSMQPVVANLTTRPEVSPASRSSNPKVFDDADAKAASLRVTPASTAVSGRVVFQKDRLFHREFLYGFDLQYSGGSDD